MKTLLTALGVVGAFAAQAADLAADFSIVNGNPNGAWTYGTKATVTGALTPFNGATNGNFGAANFDFWFTSPNSTPNISKLISGTLNGYNGGVGGVAVGEVSLHGGANGEISVARYTVGTTGLYNLSGFFKSGDALTGQFGNIDGYLYRNSTSLFSIFNTATTSNFALNNVSLVARDTLDIMVGVGADTYLYDTTPVNLNIQLVPEPGSIAALGLGLLVIARRRRSA